MKWNLLFAVLIFTLIAAYIGTWATQTDVSSAETTTIQAMALPEFHPPANTWNVIGWTTATFSYAADNLKMAINVFSFDYFDFSSDTGTSPWVIVKWIFIALGAAIFGTLIINWLFSR